MKPEFITISIDGGAGTGKSTTAHSLSEALNLLHVDTGSHYRAVTKAHSKSMILVGVDFKPVHRQLL